MAKLLAVLVASSAVACGYRVGSGNPDGGDSGVGERDDGPPDSSTRHADGAPPGADAAPRAMQSTVFAAPAIADTYLRLSNPTFNYGASDALCADTTTDDRRMLMRIDVSALPVGLEVVEVDLHLWTYNTTESYSTQIYSIYQMLEPWSEGNLSAAAGASSWNERTAGTAWTTSGAGNGSRADLVMGSFVPAAIDTEYVVPLEPDLVAGWVADAASNHGIAIVAAGSDGACFNSTEFATASKHPTLVVTWLAP